MHERVIFSGLQMGTLTYEKAVAEDFKPPVNCQCPTRVRFGQAPPSAMSPGSALPAPGSAPPQASTGLWVSQVVFYWYRRSNRGAQWVKQRGTRWNKQKRAEQTLSSRPQLPGELFAVPLPARPGPSSTGQWVLLCPHLRALPSRSFQQPAAGSGASGCNSQGSWPAESSSPSRLQQLLRCGQEGFSQRVV